MGSVGAIEGVGMFSGQGTARRGKECETPLGGRASGAKMWSTQARFPGNSHPFLLRSSKPPNEGVFFGVDGEKADDDPLHHPFTFKLVAKTKKKVDVQTHIPNHQQQLPCLILPPSYFAAARQMRSSAAAADAAAPLPPPQSKCAGTLVVPEEKGDDDHERDEEGDYYYCFYSLKNKRVEGVKNTDNRLMAWERNHLLPRDARCVGSSHGWVAYVNPNAALNCPFYLFKHPPLSSHNFFSDSEMFRLPPMETLPQFKAVRTRKADYDHRRSNIATSSVPVTRDYIFFNADLPEYMIKHDEACPWTAEEIAGTVIDKLVLSSAPHSASSDRHSIAVAIIHDKTALAFCKLGDNKWTPLVNPRPRESIGLYIDIIYSEKDRRFYTLGGRDQLISWDLSDPWSPQITFFRPRGSLPRLTESENWLRVACPGISEYLVESSGQLFKVLRFAVPRVKEDGTLSHALEGPSTPFTQPLRCLHKTIRFEVYRLNSTKEKWEPMEGIGDHAFFVGHNHSFSLSTRHFSQLRSNCIYFSDDSPFADNYRHSWCTIRDPDRHFGIGKDTGIFHLADNTVEHFFGLSYDINSEAVPFWVAPN